MVEVVFQAVNNVAGLRMLIPEHAEVSDADRSHQRTDHLVELASSRTQDSAEGRVAHVQKRFDGSFW